MRHCTFALLVLTGCGGSSTFTAVDPEPTAPAPTDDGGGSIGGAKADAGGKKDVGGTSDASASTPTCRPLAGTWTSASTGGTRSLFTVWGLGANDVWAAGGTRILHWAGGSWTETRADDAFNALHGIWGATSSDLIAIGSIALGWNGASWTYVADTTLGPVWSRTGSVRAISGSAANDIWMVGEFSTTYHFDGATWSSVAKPNIYVLHDVWAGAKTNAYAVGAVGTVQRWDGTTWKLEPTGTTAGLYGVWAIGSDAWAVGDGGTILRRVGGTWVPQASGTTNWLFDVWGSAPDDVWAVGWQGTIVHFDGCKWSLVASGTTKRLNAIWGSGAEDYWAVGDDGLALHFTP